MILWMIWNWLNLFLTKPQPKATVFFTFDKFVFGVLFSEDRKSYPGWWNPMFEDDVIPFHDFTGLIEKEIKK